MVVVVFVVESAPTGGGWLFTDDVARFLLSVVVMVVCDEGEEKWCRCWSGDVVEEEKDEEERMNGEGEEKKPVDKSRCLLLTASTNERFLRCVISFVFVLDIRILFSFDVDDIGCFWTINLTFLLLLFNVSLSVIDGITYVVSKETEPSNDDNGLWWWSTVTFPRDKSIKPKKKKERQQLEWRHDEFLLNVCSSLQFFLLNSLRYSI